MMEKLLDLLNEYGKGYFELDDEGGIVDGNQDTLSVTSSYITMQIISKEFGFIKRLVDNDKIDFDKFPQVMEYSDYESLLMILSIQDNPIEYLCSILK